MSESGELWRRQDELRRQQEDRHEMMKAIGDGDTAWALRHIAGPGAAIDFLQMLQGAPTPSEPDDDRDPAEPTLPYGSVTTMDELLANVSSTPTDVELRVTGVDRDGDAVVEALTEWVAGPPVVAAVLGLDSPPAVGSFRVRAALLGDIATVAATLRRTAALAADIERQAGG